MSNSYFRFKQFTIQQDQAAMKVCTDACLFGAWVASRIGEDRAVQKILDIGAGTGLLSLMLAQQTAAWIEAVEIDEPAAAQAKENVMASPWTERITVFHRSIREMEKRYPYDVIISNPPFFEQDLQADDKRKNLARHSEGLNFRELTEEVASQLSDNGRAYLLIPEHRGGELLGLAAGQGLFPSEIVQVKQTPRHSFFRSMFCLSSTRQKPVQKEMSIRDQHGAYTDAFRELLSGYYLYL